MAKVDTNVQDLVGMIRRGELRLPEMQRRYVWRAPRVRDLLDSLYRGYPSGSILVWETEQPQPSRDMDVAQATNPFAGHKLLLDGQQRLTSLSAVLQGEPVKVRGRKREIEILFNLDHPEGLFEFSEVVEDEDQPLLDEDEAEDQDESDEDDDAQNGSLQERLKNMTFVVSSRQLAQKPNWVSVSKVFCSADADILIAAGVQSFDDPRYKKYSERLKKLRAVAGYPYTMHVLSRDLSYEEVAEIFVRVNSLGVKLRGSDLALAQITARWPNSLKLLEEFQDECEQYWMTLDLGLLVRSLVVFATGQSRFETVRNIPVEKMKQGWELAKNGLRFAINFLRTNADIEDESLLSSPLFFVAIAYFSYMKKEHLSPEEERTLLRWLYTANAKGRYSRGSSETLLDADLATLRKGGSATDLIETVGRQFGRLDFDPMDFKERGAGSPLFPLVFLALKKKGAKDWKSGIGLSLTHQGKYHYIQYHHVFPKSKLKGHYETREINEIANMAFVAGKTNRQISNRDPVDYLPEVVKSRGDDALTMQLVPIQKDLWELENYRAFLEKRRTLLAEACNTFIANVS
jgi:hypothetical protein